MGALLIQRKMSFNNLKLCYSPALVATCLNSSAKMEQFTTPLRAVSDQGNPYRVSRHFR